MYILLFFSFALSHRHTLSVCLLLRGEIADCSTEHDRWLVWHSTGSLYTSQVSQSLDVQQLTCRGTLYMIKKTLKPDKFFMASHLRTTGCHESMVSHSFTCSPT